MTAFLWAWPIRHPCVELDEVSGEERRENRIFACFWKGLHESVTIRKKE